MTAYEDTLEGPRDRYDRLSYRNSILAKYNLIEFPLIDEYAMLLRRELQEAGAALSVHRPRIVPTHDVDNLWRFRSPLSAAKSIIGGDLLHRRDPAIAADSLRSVMHSRCMPELDPLNQACIRLCTLSAEHGLTSEFYFLGYGRDETDWRYDVQQPFVHQLMEDLERLGAIIGFHGGMGSYTHAGCYAAQKQRVDHAYGKTTACGRQHYLLFSALETPAILENAGLHADASLGFFDREGFRCGTCHPYPLYDLKRDCPLSVMERPLLLMDGTLREYRGLSIDEAMVSARGLLERVLAVGGEFVILWHNGCVHREWTPWFHQLYVPFIQYAASCCK